MPIIILPYYCTIGGWVLKYFAVFATGKGFDAAESGYFSDYVAETAQPIILMVIYLAITAFVVFCGVNKGIEKLSKVLMPILLFLIIGISIYTLTLSYTDATA